MANSRKVKRVHICETCHGNGYVRVATLTGNPSDDFRDKSEVHQCWDCDSEGEFYETSDNYYNDADSDDNTSNKLH